MLIILLYKGAIISTHTDSGRALAIDHPGSCSRFFDLECSLYHANTAMWRSSQYRGIYTSLRTIVVPECISFYTSKASLSRNPLHVCTFITFVNDVYSQLYVSSRATSSSTSQPQHIGHGNQPPRPVPYGTSHLGPPRTTPDLPPRPRPEDVHREKERELTIKLQVLLPIREKLAILEQRPRLQPGLRTNLAQHNILEIENFVRSSRIPPTHVKVSETL